MSCPYCNDPNLIDVSRDYDYTRMAGLRGKKVMLREVSVTNCARCGDGHVTIPRLAQLHRELEACRALTVKELHATFIDNEWVVSFAVPKKGRKL